MHRSRNCIQRADSLSVPFAGCARSEFLCSRCFVQFCKANPPRCHSSDSLQITFGRSKYLIGWKEERKEVYDFLRPSFHQAFVISFTRQVFACLAMRPRLCKHIAYTVIVICQARFTGSRNNFEESSIVRNSGREVSVQSFRIVLEER